MDKFKNEYSHAVDTASINGTLNFNQFLGILFILGFIEKYDQDSMLELDLKVRDIFFLLQENDLIQNDSLFHFLCFLQKYDELVVFPIKFDNTYEI